MHTTCMYLSTPCKISITILSVNNLLKIISDSFPGDWFPHNFHQPELPYINLLNWSNGPQIPHCEAQKSKYFWGSMPPDPLDTGVLTKNHLTSLPPLLLYTLGTFHKWNPDNYTIFAKFRTEIKNSACLNLPSIYVVLQAKCVSVTICILLLTNVVGY